MAKLIVENLTMAQAETFAEWYEGQGEQDACIWFDENCEDDAPMADNGKPGGCIVVDKENQTIILYTKS